jgi:CheY-like chemotaxis protein
MHQPQRQSILLADDDDEVRCGVADLLGSLGLDVLHASTGLEAVELLRVRPCHAALLDWHMPVCTGLQALPLLLEVKAGLPCILYSGDLTSEMEQLAREAGAVAVLKKPVPPERLRSEVLRAIACQPFFPEGPAGRN